MGDIVYSSGTSHNVGTSDTIIIKITGIDTSTIVQGTIDLELLDNNGTTWNISFYEADGSMGKRIAKTLMPYSGLIATSANGIGSTSTPYTYLYHVGKTIHNANPIQSKLIIQ